MSIHNISPLAAIQVGILVLLGSMTPLTGLRAGELPKEEHHVQACLKYAAGAFGLNVLHLEVLRTIEGGRTGTQSRNENGTYDLGPMQVNTRWLKQVARFGVTADALRDHACVNAVVAAWIYKQEIALVEGNVALAIANYHSKTPRHQARYLGLALRAIERHRRHELSGAGESGVLGRPGHRPRGGAP